MENGIKKTEQKHRALFLQSLNKYVERKRTVQLPLNLKESCRRSMRLKGYDYSKEGAYFVTVCTDGHQNSFGKIIDGRMQLNENGKIAREEWLKTAGIRNELQLDEFVVMPDHFHGIVFIKHHVGATGRSPLRDGCPRGPQRRSLGSFMAGFKSAVTKRVNARRKTPKMIVWQRNYYEHIIRDEIDLNEKREYIRNNPVKPE